MRVSRPISFLEKKFIDSKKNLTNKTLKKSSFEEKKSYFENFLEQVKKENKDITIALKEKFISVIKNYEPEQASKIILELIWICKKEIFEYFKQCSLDGKK